MPQSDAFQTAAFAIDGQLLGVGPWRVADLSPRWLGVCGQMLADLGPAFRTRLGPPLGHLEVKLTSAAGAGLGTFFAGGRLIASTAYLRGSNPDAEREVARIFVDSLRRVAAVGAAAAESGRAAPPFEELFGVRERPLHVVVPWPDPTVSDEDANLVSEFANHFAAAFLCRRPD